MFGLNHAQEAFIILVLSVGVLYFYWTLKNIRKRKKKLSDHWKQKKLGKRQKDIS